MMSDSTRNHSSTNVLLSFDDIEDFLNENRRQLLEDFARLYSFLKDSCDEYT